MKKDFSKKLLLIMWTTTLILMILQFPALPQVPFPTRPVTIWDGFPPGGTTDIIIRILVEGAEKSLGQKMVVINKPGGGGTVCASLIAKEKPDGYTIASFTDTPVTRAPHLGDLDFDPFRDLDHIIRVGLWKNAFWVRADSPFKKWEDVVEWAKKNPGQLIFGHPGAGTTPHLAMVIIAKKESFTFKSVAFAGAVPTLNALFGGHVMITAGSTLVYRSHAEAKTLKPLLVIEKEGIDYAPATPTFKQVGYDFELPTSFIISAPKGIPDYIREILEKTSIDRVKQETFRRSAKNQELLLAEPLTGKALVDYLKKFNLIYEEYIKEAGIYKKEQK